MRRLLTLLFTLLFAVLAFSLPLQPAFSGNLENAEAAYGAGDFADALALLRPLLNAENADAQYLYARMLENGDGVEKNESEAIKYYRLAAEQDLKKARERLAQLQEKKKADDSVTLQWYLPAAEAGDVEAQYNLGYMYETGWGVPVNETEAARWYRKAAEMQHDTAQLRLGLMLMTGVGVPQDVSDGTRRVRAAAENGNRIAEALVQDVFEAPAEWKLDKTAIVKGLRRILDEGEDKVLAVLIKKLDKARATVKVASAGAVRQSPPKPPKPPVTPEAPKRRAVAETKTVPQQRPPQEKAVTSAQFNIGKAFDQGLGVSKDDREMLRWYRTAAAQGNADAQFRLGMLYMQGRGVPRDRPEALRWLRRASEQDHKLAASYLDLVETGLGFASQGASIGLEWLRDAALQGNTDAFYLLGYMFEMGRGVSESPSEALKWYRLAAEQGHDQAVIRANQLERAGFTPRTGSDMLAGAALPAEKEDRSAIWTLVAITVVSAFLALGVVVPRRLIKVTKLSVPLRRKTLAGSHAHSAAGVVHQDDISFVKELWTQPESEAGVVPEAAEPTHNTQPVGDALPPQPANQESLPEANPTADSSPPAGQAEVSTPTPQEGAPETSSPAAGQPEKRQEPVLSGKEIAAEDISIEGADFSIATMLPEEDRAAVKLDSTAFMPDTPEQISASSVAKEKRALHRINAEQLGAEAIGFSSHVRAEEGESQTDEAPVTDEPIMATGLETPAMITDPPADVMPSTEGKEGKDLAGVQFGIGLMFAKGDGVPKNDLLAAKWYRRAAEHGHLEAQFRLGEMYAVGRGVKKNNATALEWLRKAAAGGYKPAQALLERQKKRAM